MQFIDQSTGFSLPISILFCEVWGYGFNVHPYTLSELNSQPEWLSQVNEGGGEDSGIQVSP